MSAAESVNGYGIKELSRIQPGGWKGGLVAAVGEVLCFQAYRSMLSIKDPILSPDLIDVIGSIQLNGRKGG